MSFADDLRRTTARSQDGSPERERQMERLNWYVDSIVPIVKDGCSEAARQGRNGVEGFVETDSYERWRFKSAAEYPMYFGTPEQRRAAQRTVVDRPYHAGSSKKSTLRRVSPVRNLDEQGVR